jgi:hypothetical protein
MGLPRARRGDRDGRERTTGRRGAWVVGGLDILARSVKQHTDEGGDRNDDDGYRGDGRVPGGVSPAALRPALLCDVR